MNDIERIRIVPENDIPVASSHSRKGIGRIGGLPYGRRGRSIKGIAVTCAIGIVYGEEDIIRR